MAGFSGPQRGFSLVMVLVLLGALALGSTHSLRSASGSQKVATSFRMQGLALQSAEAALRFCESQVLLPDAQRLSVLRDEALPLTSAKSPAWTQAAGWASGTLASAPVDWVRLTEPGAWPMQAPVCQVEKQPAGAGLVHVVTARGFSPDWRGDASVATLSGSSVWLQSVLLIHGGVVRERAQRRILQPPVR